MKNTNSHFSENAYLTYDIIADWYEANRCYSLFEKPLLDKITTLIKPACDILDIGCGTGKPIMEFFLKQGYNMVGVDASVKLLEKAKMNFPEVEFLLEDMRNLNLNRKFDCIIVWHSLFHLPKMDQMKMFQIFEQHIKPNGILLFTSGPQEGEVWSDNGGEQLYHASLSPEQYIELLEANRFKVILHQIQESSLQGATIWLAQKDEI